MRDSVHFQTAQIPDQIPNSEICWIALPSVAELLANVKSIQVGRGEPLAAVTRALENGLDQLVVLPRQTSKQNGDSAALLGGKRSFCRPPEMLDGHVRQAKFLFEASAFQCELLSNHLLSAETACQFGSVAACILH